MLSCNGIRTSFSMVLHNLLAKTGACNSSRGIVSSFKGATRDFAATNLTLTAPVDSSLRRYAHAPKAPRDASAKTHRIGGSTVSAGYIHLSSHTLFNWLFLILTAQNQLWLSMKLCKIDLPFRLNTW